MTQILTLSRIIFLSIVLGTIMTYSTGCSPSTDDPEDVSPENNSVAHRLAERLDGLLSEYSGVEIAISVIDPSQGVVLHGNGSRLFHAASTMKVPVLIELFRQRELGRLTLDDSLLVVNDFKSIVDGSRFAIEEDSDDGIYERLGTRMSLRDLAYQMITVSSNLATNLLVDKLSADSIQATSVRLGTTDALTLRGVEDLLAFEQGLNNQMTSHDLAVLMEAIRTGIAVSPEADKEMIGMLLDQHFNSMITAGMPTGVKVAHKTGSITRIHHDAGIIFPPGADSFTLVIMTEGIEDREESGKLGARIAAVVYDVLRGNAVPSP